MRSSSFVTMPTEPVRTRARLIPVSGIGSVQEAEQRATSALLAVLSVVRELSIDLLAPLGASKAQRARGGDLHRGQHAGKAGAPRRADPSQPSARQDVECLVEVKTGTNTLTAEQINAYWDLAREYDVRSRPHHLQ